MYKLKKEEFAPKEVHHKDQRYFIEIFQELGVLEDSEYIYLPDEVTMSIKKAPLTTSIYHFFDLVWSNEQKEIDIEDIIGSHDSRNYELKTWLANFLYNDITKENFDKYLKNPMAIFQDTNNPLKAFEINGNYYLADGHHRFSCLYLHYHILKSQNKLPEYFKEKIISTVRVVPNDLDFVNRFVDFCIYHHLYEEDEISVIPIFEILDSNPDNPIILHSESNVQITKDSNLDEVLEKIKKESENQQKHK